MGPAGHRRHPPVREDLPRGLPVRPVVADDPPEARELPRGLRRLRLSRRSPASARRTSTRLLADAGIVRHRGKIESTINNARRAVELEREEGSLAAYFWRFEPEPKSRPKRLDSATLRAMPTTPESIALSKDLKKRGWSFVGPTTVYAFMQAMGLVNDHLDGCCCRTEVEAKGRLSAAPSEVVPVRPLSRSLAALRPVASARSESVLAGHARYRAQLAVAQRLNVCCSCGLRRSLRSGWRRRWQSVFIDVSPCVLGTEYSVTRSIARQRLMLHRSNASRAWPKAS